jgi:hypothetical protein
LSSRGEPALQQHQARLEVVADVGQPQPRIEPQLAVGELRAAVLDVVARHQPQHRAGDALDQVVLAEEHAVVVRIVAQRHRRQVGRGGRARSPAGAARPPAAGTPARAAPARPGLVRLLRLQQRQRRAELRGERDQRVLVVVAEAHVLRALDVRARRAARRR